MNYLTNDTSIKEFGAAIVLDTPDGIDGYTTLGWREDKTANVATVESGSTATINSNKTYYGVYKKSLTLSYAANGGDTIPDSVTKTIYYNSSMADAEVASTYSLANAITRTGYSFTGWMVENDPSKTYQAGANISIKKNTKMYAKWEAKSYVVTYDYLTNGGTSVSVGSKKATYLTNVDLTPTATRAGYEFVGWSTNPADKEPLEEYKMPFEDITLYAIFKKKVTATWLMVDPLAGSIEKATTSCYKFNNATTCQIETGNVITNAGYTALGFAATSGSKDVIAGNNIFTDIASDKTFYSVTRKTAPLVGTFYYGEGTTSKTMNANCVLYNGATSCTISAPIEPVTYKNVPFVNWSSNKTSYVASNMTISSNKNYYAYYNQILMLTYHDGETDNILTETKELKYIISDTGEAATIPTITTKTPTSISGYTTLGWREDDVQGEATQASNQTKQITQSYEYYAVYKRTITLSYNANNGSTTPANQTATQYFNAAAGATNHTFTLAAAIARPGYTFVSWTKGSTTGTEYAAGTSINILEDAVFYAKWVLNNFTLTYNANGGTLTEKSKIVHYGEAYGALPKPTRTGHDFAGWFTAATGGNEIKAETIVSELKDHTIYAHWNVHKNTLTRTVDNAKFGSVSGPSGSVAYDTSVTLVATPMAGFIFAGWYEGNTMVSYDATYTFKMPDRAVSLIAKFSFDITSITDINVLNVYPDTGNSLKTWMETNGYGKSIIRVTPVSITNFNANPGAYLGSSGKWNYDVVVYGFWDSNGSKDISASAATLTAQYLDENNPVVFGHDTLRATFPNFAKLMPYVNITSKTGSSNYTSNQIIINRTGIFTTYPWSIGNEGTILTIPSTHVSSQYANGDIWLQLGSTAMSDRNNFYLTTYQNAAMIQTGHSSGQATNDEQKILANLIFFLYSQKVMSEL